MTHPGAWSRRLRGAMLALLSCAGCAPKTITVHPAHILMFDKSGMPLDPAEGRADEETIQAGPSSFKRPFASPEQYVLRLERILDQAEKKGRLFIFAHGGMADPGRSAQILHRFMSAGLEQDAYLLGINWDTGLFSSYLDHLFLIRSGKRSPIIGPLTSPLVLAKDLLVGLGRAPVAWYEELISFWNGNAGVNGNLGDKTLRYLVELEASYARCPAPSAAGCTSIPFYAGRDRLTKTQEAGRITKGVLSAPFVMASLGLLNETGQEGWRSMLRREELLFDSEDAAPAGSSEGGLAPQRFTEYKSAFRGAPAAPARALDAATKALQEGGMSVALSQERPLAAFFVLLQDRQAKARKSGRKPLAVVLAGHSMGCIVVDDILLRYPDLEVDKVFYLGSADTLLNYRIAAWPYMRRELERRKRYYGSLGDFAGVYHIVLNDLQEARETNWEIPFTPFYLSPSGSLLVYIDNVFGQPNSRLDRVAGRMSNLAPILRQTPVDIAPYVHVRSFDALVDQASKAEPETHRNLRSFKFWEPSCYDPASKDHACAPLQ